MSTLSRSKPYAPIQQSGWSRSSCLWELCRIFPTSSSFQIRSGRRSLRNLLPGLAASSKSSVVWVRSKAAWHLGKIFWLKAGQDSSYEDCPGTRCFADFLYSRDISDFDQRNFQPQSKVGCPISLLSRAGGMSLLFAASSTAYRSRIRRSKTFPGKISRKRLKTFWGTCLKFFVPYHQFWRRSS